jgi:hypothetical protein
MKKIKPLHPTVAAAVLIVAILGYSGCTTLDSHATTSSAMRSTPAQHVSYQQPSKQPEVQRSSDQRDLEATGTSEDASLIRDIDPGWGPLNIPL